MTGPSSEAPAAAATLIDAFAVGALPWHDLEGFAGVTYKVLWQSGKSVAGIMRIPPDSQVSPHVHQRSHHHLWLLDGSAEILDRRVAAGSYAHIAAGVEHGITAPGPEGCTVLYLYLRDESAS